MRYDAGSWLSFYLQLGQLAQPYPALRASIPVQLNDTRMLSTCVADL
jgi:hypothetical protein